MNELGQQVHPALFPPRIDMLDGCRACDLGPAKGTTKGCLGSPQFLRRSLFHSGGLQMGAINSPDKDTGKLILVNRFSLST